MNVTIGSLDTPLGRLLFASTDVGLCGLSFRDTPRARAHMTAGLRPGGDPKRAEPVREQLTAYFAGRRRDFELPIDWRHTSRLQREVLARLRANVRYGEVVTYGGLAELSGTGVPARAIGSIMGSNPIPIVVPCHRVIAGNGLGGYSGGTGVEVKRWLLTLEGALPATLDWDPSAGPAAGPHVAAAEDAGRS